MTLPIEHLLLQMREHQHLPGMPRIRGKMATATCLRCGERASVRAGRRGQVRATNDVGRALLADCSTDGRRQADSPQPSSHAQGSGRAAG